MIGTVAIRLGCEVICVITQIAEALIEEIWDMASVPPAAGSVARSPLLHAWHDPLAGIKTHSACAKLADLNCDGDAKLVICDYDKKIRVYRGTSLVTETSIIDVPIAMCVTYMEASLVSFTPSSHAT